MNYYKDNQGERFMLFRLTLDFPVPVGPIKLQFLVRTALHSFGWATYTMTTSSWLIVSQLISFAVAIASKVKGSP
jgi:hypothetical protein